MVWRERRLALAAGRRARAFWGLALAAGLQSCLLFVVVPSYQRSSPEDYHIAEFPDEYADIATNLVGGNGYRVHEDTAPTMIREPGYVLLLAAVFCFYPRDLHAVQVVNLAIALLTAACTARVARRMGLSPGVGAFGASLFLVNPAVLFAESRGGVDILFTLLATTVVLLLYRALQRDSTLDFVLLGGAIGLAGLVKSTLLLLPVLLVPYALLRAPGVSRRRLISRLVLLVAATMTVLTPWVVRNYVVSGSFVPTMTLAGSVAQEGLYAAQKGATELDFWRVGQEASGRRAELACRLGFKYREGWHPSFFYAEHEVAFNRFLLVEVIREYEQRPILLLRTIGDNAWRFWFQGRTRVATAMNVALVLPFLVASMCGVVVGRPRRLDVGPALVFVLYFYTVHLPLQGLARYHIPLIPEMSVLSAICLVAALDRLGLPVPRMRPEGNSTSNESAHT